MKRNSAIDLFKFIAMPFIIAIHLFLFEYVNSTAYILINSVARFAVPFFFISAGYLLNKKTNSVDDPWPYVTKYLLNITKIYFVWTTIYLMFNSVIVAVNAVIAHDSIISAIGVYFKSAFKIKSFIADTDVSYHLWFLRALILSVLVLYIFIRIKKMKILLICSLLLNLTGLFGQSYSCFANLPIQTSNAWFFGIFYLTLGYYISQKENRFKGHTKLWIFLCILFFLLQSLEAFTLVNIFGAKLANYYISTIPLSIFLFALVINIKNIKSNNFFAKLGERSIGIYVIHLLVMISLYTFFKIIGEEEFNKSLIWGIISVPLILCITCMLDYIIQRLKKRLVHYVFSKKTMK